MAITVATRATPTDVRNACWSPVLAIASPIHLVVKPDGGQADVPLWLKA
jgi:hypothetical protein